jgi:site-specific DNA-methyltransferase (adenine-specific)
MTSRLVLTGHCREVLAVIDSESVDAVVCDPPYELGFMAKSWDTSGIA